MPTKAPKETKASKEKGGKAEPAASPGGQKPNALQKALQPSKELAAVVGTGQGNRVKPIKSFLRTAVALWVMFARRSVLLLKSRLENRWT